MKKLILLFLIISAQLPAIRAINWFRNVDVRNGLRENYVCDMRYSPDGLLYIATKLGIDVFDGNRIEHLHTAYPDQCHPERLAFDRNGNLWAIWKDSLMIYDGKGFSSDRRLQTQKASEARFCLPPALVSDMVIRGKRLAYLTPSGDLFHTENNAVKATKIGNIGTGYKRISLGQDNRIWFFDGMSEGLAYTSSLQPASGTSVLPLFNGKLVRSVECTPGGKIIVGTNNDGIFVLDHTGRLTEHLRYDMNDPASLPSDHIASLLVHNGYLFAGTTKKGITIACLHPLEVKRVNTGIDADICFFSPLNDGRLAIGFDGGGLCVYDSIGSPVPSRHFTTANSSLPSDMVLGVARNDGRTYFSSYGGGIFSLDGKDFVVADNSDSLKFCRHIICLPDGSTLAATFGNGLIHIGRRTYNFDNSPLRTNSITCLHRAGDHVLVGTSTGLYLFDSNTKTITPSADSELASLLVLDIHVDSHGFTWLGTSEGVLVLNHQMKIIRRITRRDHLSNNFVKAIASDLNDGIWVTTVDGINHIRVTVACEDSIDFVCTPYMARDGIGEIDFDRHSIACAPDGRILAGGQGRYVIIDPASARTKKSKSNIKFTGLSVDGVCVEPGRPVASGRIVIDSPIISSPEITIDYFNGITVDFSTLSPEGDSGRMFEYRLDDNSEWSCIEGPVLNLAAMAPGRYELAIREAGTDTTGEIVINVMPPLWKSTAACIAYCIAAAALLLLAVRYISRHYRQRLYSQKIENVFVRNENAPLSADEIFLTKAKNLIEQNMGDENFSVEALADLMAMSRSNLYKKMSKAAGRTPVEFIRLTRLREGKKLLDSGETSVSQTAYAIGMSPKFFSKSFKDEFGVSPSKYISGKADDTQ